jgi:hypothetical protein
LVGFLFQVVYCRNRENQGYHFIISRFYIMTFDNFRPVPHQSHLPSAEAQPAYLLPNCASNAQAKLQGLKYFVRAAVSFSLLLGSSAIV